MVVIAGAVALALFAVLAAFQLALAVGMPWGRAANGGAHPGVLPPRLRIVSAVAAVVWVGVALSVARGSGIGVWSPLPDAALPVAMWVVVGVLGIAAVLNTITRSRIERAIWLPVTLALLACVLVVALAA